MISGVSAENKPLIPEVCTLIAIYSVSNVGQDSSVYGFIIKKLCFLNNSLNHWSGNESMYFSLNSH